MWIKVNYYQNIFTGLEFSYFAIFDQKVYFKNVWNGKNYKSASRFRSQDLKIRS